MITNKCGIYRITNTVTGDYYIGSSVNIPARTNRHERDLRANRHTNLFLQRSWNKYGEDVFSLNAILYCDKSTKLYFEQLLLDTLKPSFNLAKDALAPMQGRKHTEETLKRMSETRTGRKYSDETRKRMSEATTGERNPNFGKYGENSPRYGKTHTDDAKQRMSEALTGRYPTEETRRRLSESCKGERNPNFGKHFSEETKQKMSEIATRQWAKRKAEAQMILNNNVVATG